ncbi:taxane 13-alpha-hydroxylase-like [Diospyros lotus]|uniref:taxane 13-alpha-hydroxylase-like n=1 Tax=Diospyros lotus TaxID=55363 RepID=UPI00225C3F24|nr:taxane 13-alpha-hydroxylase-like [Diospyros lotus]
MAEEMPLIALAVITLVSVFFLFKFLKKGSNGSKNLPRGSLGWPLIGETLSFLQAQKEDRGHEWISERVSKYGKIFKTSLMGAQTVIIVGQAGNKFILGSDDEVLAAKQPWTASTIVGKNNVMELTGRRYRLIKGAMVSFLKPENLQNYVKQMDDAVTSLLLRETEEEDTIKTVVFMKKLTYNIACNILFGIRDEHTKQIFSDDFMLALKGVWSLPVNFPGTLYWKGMRARERIVSQLLPILEKRKEDLSKGVLSPTDDLISCLVALRDENGEAIKEEEVVDNIIAMMIASHDTSAILLSLMVWKMSRDKQTYNQILEEQMDIVRNRNGAEDQKLTWVDIQMMKHTWRVAQELMRMIPPVFGTFRKALKDTNFDGYDIPKGWQLLWVACETHMDKDIFGNPQEFDPNRFNKPSKPIPPYTYVPFGGGMHTCIGNEFARVETLTTIHRLVTMFEWSQIYPDEGFTRQPMPYPAMGLPIKVRPRSTPLL